MWSKAPADLQLSADHIDIWSTHLDLSEQEVKAFAQTLSADEISRAKKFTFANKYREYVVSRGLLRAALASLTSNRAKDFHFDYTEHDKPYLQSVDISFNVSHSHDFALVAIGLKRNIGVDIEKIRENVEYEKLAKRFFSGFEHAALMQVPKRQRERVFYTIWTRKEAFVKAIGKGIAFGLSEFDVSIEADEPAALLRTRWDEKAVEKWKLANISVEDGYVAALASDGGDFDLRYWHL